MNDDAFRSAVLEHKDRVFGYAARLLGDREEAKDVAQEALTRMWERREAIEGGDGARFWLLRAAHNLCVDRLRRRGARFEVGDGALDEIEAGDCAPDRAACGRETAAAIERALAGLPARDRAALLLREAHGLSYDELAATLGVPLGTAKAILHRAREKAQRALVAAGVRP